MAMKRGQDWGGDRAPKRGRRVTEPCVLKVLTQEILASAIIGKGGAVIKDIREATGARLAFTGHEELYPGTDCRVLTISGDTEEALNETVAQVLGRISECIKDGAVDLSDNENPVLRALVPRMAASGIIGKGGAGIKGLRESTGCKINVAEAYENGPQADQVVTISGTQSGLEQVMAEVNRHIHEVASKADWFEDWASNPGCEFVQEKGKGGGKGKGKDSGKGGGKDRSWEAPPPRHQESSRAVGGGGSRGGGRSHPSITNLMGVASGLPNYVLDDQRGFALSCVVPNAFVGGLIGRGGSGTKEVQAQTNTKIAIRDIPGDPESRSLNISGPLADACAAYMLMMKRYLEVEANEGTGARVP